jgi:hypothetical protein
MLVTDELRSVASSPDEDEAVHVAPRDDKVWMALKNPFAVHKRYDEALLAAEASASEAICAMGTTTLRQHLCRQRKIGHSTARAHTPAARQTHVTERNPRAYARARGVPDGGW